MTQLLGKSGARKSSAEGSAGLQRYFLKVVGPDHARALSVVSFEARERIGEPYRITLDLTCPVALDQGDYLGRDAAFTISPTGGAEPRTFSGCITRFSKLKTTVDLSFYQVVIEAHLARLKLTRSSRIYQHRTAPQIIEAVLRRHGFKGHQFLFKLRRAYPEHKFRLQYQIDDWSYIHMLMQQEGLYGYIVPGKFGDVVVFGDDIDHYIYQPELNVPYRESSGLVSDAPSVSTLQTHIETVPASFLVADYNPEQAWERYKAEANVASKDTTTYGQPYVYGTHHLDQQGARWEAQLRHEAAIAWQIVYEGASTVFELCPARILRMDQVLADAPNGQLIIEVTHSGARDQAYRNTYKAIPCHRRFRLKLEDHNWPRITGTLSGRVTSTGTAPFAYLTAEGYYRVRFDLDFETWPAGAESVPLRLARPFAGSAETGFHFPVLAGTEAVLEFRDGDPNKPYISHFHHNSQQPDLITSKDRWYSRNVIRTQSNNKLRFEDWKGYEGIKLSTEYAGKSQLNLGYLVDSKKQKRGEGFELRSGGWGAVRANRGLLLSAYGETQGPGPQLEMTPLIRQLQTALDEATSLRDIAAAAQAELSEVKAQQARLERAYTELKEAVLLLSAPKGIAAATPDSIQLSSGQHLTATTGGNADFSIIKKFTVAAGQFISLLAHKMGIKLFAVEGKVEIQAQKGSIEMTSNGDILIKATGRIVLAAEQEMLLACNGAFLRLAGGQPEVGGSSNFHIKTPSITKDGPATVSAAMPTFKQGDFAREFYLHHEDDPQTPIAYRRFRVHLPDGTVTEGVTDAKGKSQIFSRSDIAHLRIDVLGPDHE